MKWQIMFGVAITATSFSFAQSTTFSYTGVVQTYSVPACVSSITVDAKGASGAIVAPNHSAPGPGGRVQATISVTPGEILSIYIGKSPLMDTGGWNGGGNGGILGGGGGGASDIRQGGTALTNRVIVAAGGGGGGYDDGHVYVNTGGYGGGLIGGTGRANNATTFAFCGGGGTQTAGGSGGTNTAGNAFPGTLGMGGNADPTYGGGGGGGYYGGGGGTTNLNIYGAGGGGGSSYAIPSATGLTHTQNFNNGNGSITITPVFTPGPAAPGMITGPSTACENSMQLYSIAIVPNATSYNWTPPAGSTVVIGQGNDTAGILLGPVSGMINVTASNACGTSAPSTFSLTVIPATNPTITATATNFCSGDSVELVSSPGSSYLWSTGATTQSIWVTTSGTYSLTVPDANGCMGIDDITVTSNPSPTVSFSGLNSGYCVANPPASLTGSPVGGTFSGPGISGSAFDPWAAGIGTHTINYTYTDANGCGGTESQSTVVGNTTYFNLGNDTMICSDASFVLSPGNFANYSWHDNSTNPTYTVSGSALGIGTHFIYVNVIDGSGCTGSDTIIVLISPCTGFLKGEELLFEISPNPADEKILLQVGNLSGSLTIELVDLQGNIVLRQLVNNLTNGQAELDISAIAEGLYFLRINVGEHSSVKKVIVE